MSTTQMTKAGPICTHGDISVNPLSNLISLAYYADPHSAGIAANAALLQHADQERIAKALEDLLEPLCVIANTITRYEGKSHHEVRGEMT